MTDDRSPVWIALTFAIGVALVQIPILFLNVIPTAFVFVGGWILICGYTFYRAWQLNTQSFVVNDVGLAKRIAVGLIKLSAGVFILGLSGTLLYLGVIASYSPASDNITWRIKGAFAGNGFVALDAATLCLFGTFAVEKIRTLLSWFKR